jgi:hypothetical protein
MTDQEEKERRFSIQSIMKDPKLTPHERRKSIQYLMDGRRRSSVSHLGSNIDGKRVSLESGMAIAAAFVASSFDDEDSSPMSKKRSSPLLLQESPHSPGNEQLPKRQASLHESLSKQFSSFGVRTFESTTEFSESDHASARMMEKSRPPCGHYQRNCSIVSPCCGLVFGCRICHNDAPNIPPPIFTSGGNLMPQYRPDSVTPSVEIFNSSATASATATTKLPARSPDRKSSLLSLSDDESHHEIDRFAIEEVICRECFTRQSSKT